jgi:nucleotide-binding universal stress UspA family protein
VQTIVVGYDETGPATRALDRAVQLADAFGSKLIVTSVAPVEYYVARSAGPVQPGESVDEHRDQLAAARAHIGDTGLDVEYVPAAGEPADTIVEVANQHGADLIVVGTRDPGIVERLLGQSVSESVARHADCDVLIVHGGT